MRYPWLLASICAACDGGSASDDGRTSLDELAGTWAGTATADDGQELVLLATLAYHFVAHAEVGGQVALDSVVFQVDLARSTDDGPRLDLSKPPDDHLALTGISVEDGEMTGAFDATLCTGSAVACTPAGTFALQLQP